MNQENQNLSSSNSEIGFEKKIRPKTFDDFIGQNEIKKALKTYIDAAKERGESLDHILFYGPPGLGKTTLSHLISESIGST